MFKRSVLVLVTSFVLLVPVAVSQGHKRAAKSTKPSIKITGISVNEFNAKPGTRITYHPNRPVNACYDIGGPGQDPYSTTVVFFIHARHIPKSAPTTITWTTPWDGYAEPNSEDEHPHFGGSWFTNRGHGIARIYGGSDAPGNFYRYDNESGGDGFNGHYSVTTTVKVHGKTLRAHGTLNIDCDD